MGCEAMAMQHRETGLPFVAAKASLNAGIVDVYSAKIKHVCQAEW